jgi:4-hydroxy-tetrahydrodipicolinate synthase
VRANPIIKKMKGIFHLVMTHFDANGEVDKKAIRKAVRFTADAMKGEDAVFVTGGTLGEFYALTDEEVKRVTQAVIEEVNGEFPVFAGASRGGTRWTVSMCRFAQEAGADGVLVVSPYYQLPTEEGVYRHFSEIASSIDIGLMIYNNPVHSKIWIPSQLMARLSKLENIVAVKENTASAVKYYWMQKTIDPDDMTIICGLGHLMFPFEAVYGCAGFFTEVANFAPQIVRDIYQAFKENDLSTLSKLTDKISPYFQLVSKIATRRTNIPTILSPYLYPRALAVSQSMIKSAMSLIGLPGGPVREPVENITPEEKDELKAVLTTIGIL